MTIAIKSAPIKNWSPIYNRYFTTAQQISYKPVQEKKQVINQQHPIVCDLTAKDCCCDSATGGQSPVPLFKNPNSSIILSSLITSSNFNAKDQSLIGGSNNEQPELTLAGQSKILRLGLEPNNGLNLSNLVFLKKKGSQTPNPNLISYNFPGAATAGWVVKTNVYKLLSHFFKSMYCLISKPVFIETPDKIKIQLFYFLCLPKILTDKNLLQQLNLQHQQMHQSAKIGTENIQDQASPSKASFAVRDRHPGQSNSITSLNLSILNLKNLANYASLFKTKKNFTYLMHQLKNFNSKNLNVKLNLIKLSQPSIGNSLVLTRAKNAAAGRALPLINVYPKNFKLICNILSKLFNKSVELELIRLHQPYYDSNILVNFLALIINKKNIGAAIQRIYNSNIIQDNQQQSLTASSAAVPFNFKSSSLDSGAYLSGLNIKISGRLMREPIIPRVTSKKFEKGFTAKGKINYLDVARFTHKNRKGAFTITVKSGQKFY